MATQHSKRSDMIGEGMTSLCSGALALNLLLVVALLAILVVNGMGYFWQRDLVEVELEDGTRILGEVHDREEIPAERLAVDRQPLGDLVRTEFHLDVLLPPGTSRFRVVATDDQKAKSLDEFVIEMERV